MRLSCYLLVLVGLVYMACSGQQPETVVTNNQTNSYPWDYLKNQEIDFFPDLSVGARTSSTGTIYLVGFNFNDRSKPVPKDRLLPELKKWRAYWEHDNLPIILVSVNELCSIKTVGDLIALVKQAGFPKQRLLLETSKDEFKDMKIVAEGPYSLLDLRYKWFYQEHEMKKNSGRNGDIPCK